MMNEEGAFPRLLELLHAHARPLHMEDDSTAGLHRLLMDLLYELSRIQKIRIEDLSECPRSVFQFAKGENVIWVLTTCSFG